jgi:integrase/recombinase XerD
MFEIYFCPRVVLRLEGRANARILEEFLGYLHGRGYARLTVQSYVRQAEVFLHWLRRRHGSLATIDEATVRQFACRHRPRGRPRADAHASLRHLVRHLREAGLIASPSPVSSLPIEKTLSEYDDHLEHVCGLALATRLRRRYFVRAFMEFVFGSGKINWEHLRPCCVQLFIAQYGRKGQVASAQAGAVAIRSFLRWLNFRGSIAANLSGAVPRFPRWRHATLPAVMTDEQLTIFLSSFDGAPTGRRDYAMALAMTDLGLRTTEVAGLMLSDMDAANGTLRLSAGKSRRDRILPMSKRLRRAIVAYLRRHRPQTDDGHLFVRHRVPVGAALSRELVRGVMRRAYACVPGCEKWTGTHVLRHTAATRMHRAGADLKRVADILGHRSLDTTVIYTKVDIDRLALVALPWPGRKEVQ